MPVRKMDLLHKAFISGVALKRVDAVLQILGDPPHPGLTACRSPVPSLAPSREKFQCDEPEPCRAIMRCANRTETIFDRVRNVLQINNPEKRGSCAPRTPFRLWSWTDQG